MRKLFFLFAIIILASSYTIARADGPLKTSCFPSSQDCTNTLCLTAGTSSTYEVDGGNDYQIPSYHSWQTYKYSGNTQLDPNYYYSDTCPDSTPTPTVVDPAK